MQRSLRVLTWVLAAIALRTIEVAAQRPNARVGLGTLLTRDRGWNYHESFEFFGAVGRSVGLLDVEAGASLIKSFAGEMSGPAFSTGPAAVPFRDGFGARLHARFPSSASFPLSVLAGAEAVWDITDGNPKTNTLGATIGAGWNLGPSRRASLDLRYVAFAKRLGTSKGILALTLGWRL